MMHGREKSGPVVVAGKRANKAEPSVAEPVERRAGAEGNACQNRGHRAQNRRSVSQALAHIRQASKSVRRHIPKVGAVCGVREESWNELASESLVRSKPSRQDGSESCGRRGDAGAGA